MSASGNVMLPPGAPAGVTQGEPRQQGTAALGADAPVWATPAAMLQPAGLGTPRRGRSPITLPSIPLGASFDAVGSLPSPTDDTGDGARRSGGGSDSADEKGDNIGKIPTFDIPLSSRRQRARSAAFGGGFGSSSFNQRLTKTVRNLIHEFLPSGANASEAERFAAARGWLSTKDHGDELATEARELWMVLWSEARVAVRVGEVDRAVAALRRRRLTPRRPCVPVCSTSPSSIRPSPTSCS